jgi:pyridine nucleotide-disulfide oxidoreductase family protein
MNWPAQISEPPEGIPTESEPATASLRARLVLGGGGHAHLAVLAAWISDPPERTDTWLVTSDPFTAYSGMVPGWMAGYYTAGQVMIDLRPLAKRAGVRLIIDQLRGLDADRKTVLLASGRTISFDVLSLATGGEADLSRLAALGERLLPVRPINEFVSNWPHLLARIQATPAFKLVIVGGGAGGVELALAADQALRAANPSARVAIVAGRGGLLSGYAACVRGRVSARLKSQAILVHNADGVGTHEGLRLSDGTGLPADGVIAATGSKPPSWLRQSGVRLDADGFITVGANLRSVSHESIYAAGDIIVRTDIKLERSGVHAVKAGPILAANLRSALNGGRMHSYYPRKNTMYLLATGDKRAILSWGRLTVSGKLIWRLKDFIDRRFVGLYRQLARGRSEADRKERAA